MLKIDNSIKFNNTTAYKGNLAVKTWSENDLEKYVSNIISEAKITGAVPSSNPIASLANRARDIAAIISSGNVTSNNVRKVEAGINLIA